MSFIKLCEATNYFNFDNAIGVGMTGIMYKATLPNGLFLAVKRLYYSPDLDNHFETEIKILGRYNHRNIVPLLGFCIEEKGKDRILVYQYMSRGKLSDWLSDCDATSTKLGWPLVTRIALGVARGLCCLHHSLHMVHLSISSECILLEENFEPRISNFGGAVFLNIHDKGTDKGFEKDVYDFGILIFELIEGKKFDQIIQSFRNINNNHGSAGFFSAIHESLIERKYEDEVSALFRTAVDCVHPFPHQRPTMLEVYRKLSNVWEGDELRQQSLTPDQLPELFSATISRDEIVEVTLQIQN
ncbi:hypothetical protein RJT34_04273 [Clitoria ternatea]|uniref:Protein kinase domain-containing protein n=1 Tax=Clitoria ternatea TaxID=43366 RepID=A0AAN9Q227_CLITE